MNSTVYRKKCFVVLIAYVGNGERMASSYRSVLLLGSLLGLACSLSLTKLLFFVFAEISPGHGDKTEADVWLQENDLPQYQTYFRERGKKNVATRFNLRITNLNHWASD
jgi:hypothetical protein